jgi:hypothetical protein
MYWYILLLRVVLVGRGKECINFVLFLFPFARSHFDWPITIFLGKHFDTTQNRSVEGPPFGAPLYVTEVQLWGNNYGINCGAIGNILRNTLGTWWTWWEHFFWMSHPHPPSVQRKRAWPPLMHVEPFHQFHENSIHKIVVTIFSLG